MYDILLYILLEEIFSPLIERVGDTTPDLRPLLLLIAGSLMSEETFWDWSISFFLLLLFRLPVELIFNMIRCLC